MSTTRISIPSTTPFDPLRTGVHNGHMIAAALNRHAGRPVLHLGGVTLTGAEMAASISQYAQALEKLTTPDAGSALLALNRPEVLLLIGAGQLSGARRTALHPLGSLDDHAYVLSDAGISSLTIDPVPMFVERAIALLDKVECLTQILTLGPVPEALEGRAIDLIAEAAKFEPQRLRVTDLPADHVTSITYTGGTTGRPKGVIGTAGAMATMTQIQLAEWEWPENPRFLACTPLSHAGSAFFLPTLMKGGEMVVLPKFDAAEVLRTIEAEKISTMMLVPSMIYALLDHPDSRTRDLSSLKTVYYGAAAINPVRLAEAIDRFGPIFAQFYGQSESPMAISYLGKADHVEGRLTSCGRPSAFLRTALIGDDGQPVAQGEPGEICVAGPLLSAGYLGLQEQTDETFGGGWLHTGDVAREDEDGFWFIVDRTKDMIVTGGFNVFPREVEDVVAEHEWVSQVGVIGVPDEKWGEAITAVIVLRPDAPSDDASVAKLTAEVTAAVKDRKGSVQAPKSVIIADEIPVTALGKPDKKALRAKYGVASAVGR